MPGKYLKNINHELILNNILGLQDYFNNKYLGLLPVHNKLCLMVGISLLFSSKQRYKIKIIKGYLLNKEKDHFYEILNNTI